MTSALPRNPTLKTAGTSNFEGLWGSSTRWKSAVPRSQRLDVYHPSSTNHGTSVQTATQPQGPMILNAEPFLERLRPPPDLNKPLPPLPAEARFQEEENSAADSTLRRKSTVSRSLKSFMTIGSMHHDAKRLATFALTSKKRKAELARGQKISSKVKHTVFVIPPPLPVVTETVYSSSSLSAIAPQTTIVPLSAVSTEARSSYVDHGTQPEASTRSYAIDRAHTFRNFAIRPALHPSNSSASSVRSPKQLSKKGGSQDYFHFQAEDIKGQVSTFAKSRQKTRSGGSQDRDNKSSSSETRSTGQLSTTSVGTYESKYSAPELGASTSVQYKRPSHNRAASDSTLTTIKRHSASEPQTIGIHTKAISPSQFTGATHRTSVVEASRFKPPIPMYSSLRPLKQHSRPAHRTENSSPLRQEITPQGEEFGTFSESPDSSIMFRVPVSYINPAEEPMYTIVDVPEHLAGSPLCPLHPKHKSYGVGICPFHGRLSLGDSDEIEEVPIKANTPQAKKSITKDEETFKLIVPKHDIDSPECPANPQNPSGGKGVCVYHGRGRPVEEEKKKKPQSSQRVLCGYIWT